MCICLVLGGCGIADPARPEPETGWNREDLAEADSSERDFGGQNPEGMEKTETEEETEIIPEPEIRTITITATGDCTLGPTQSQSYTGSFTEYYDNQGERYFFDGVRSIFEADDFTLINLECVLSDSENRVDKTFNLRGKPEYVGIMTSSSVEGCSLGNNHSQDYGPESLTDTQNVLDEAGIIYGYNDHVGIYTTEEGQRIGIVSASLLSQSTAREDDIQNGILYLKEQEVDLIIACCHWGIERDYYPQEYQVQTAHKIIDWGADLIIGNHPHVLQGVEYYHGSIICYSLGNFCFGGNKNPADKNTMIYQQTFTFVDGELQKQVDARIIPCTVSSVSGYNDFQPTVVSGEKKQDILDKVNEYSAPYSGISFDSEGILQLEQ